MDEGMAALMVSAGAGAFVAQLTTNATAWIANVISGQSPTINKKVKKNVENFLVRLESRVTRLEAELPSEKADIFNEAMEDPSSAFLIKEAIKAAAMTDNDERHALLAELIAQRLMSGGEDMIALAGNAACGVINFLSVRQLGLLAFLAVLHAIRPIQTGSLPEAQSIDAFICEWWESNAATLVQKYNLGKVNELDLEHLAAMGCIRINTFAKDFRSILSSGFSKNLNQHVLSEESMNQLSWLTSLQSIGVEGCTPTSTGTLIGTLQRDGLLKTQTIITW